MRFDDDLVAAQRRRLQERREARQRELEARRAEEAAEREKLEAARSWAGALSDQDLRDAAKNKVSTKWLRKIAVGDPRRPPAEVGQRRALEAAEAELARRERGAVESEASVAAGVEISAFEALVAIVVLLVVFGGDR